MKTKQKSPCRIISLILLILLLLCALFVGALYLYNRHCLKKEAGLIHPKGQPVEIDGKHMNIYTEGSGEHTLVFMAGANTPAVTYDFKPLYSLLSDDFRIAVIEKFGYGYSDDADGDRNLETLLRQDREALQKAGIEAPYILCPHSASGLEAVRWAQLYPEEIKAIVGLDMAVPEQFDYQIGDLSSVRTETYEERISDESFYNFWLYDVGGYRLYSFKSVFPACNSDRLTEEERAEYKAITYHWYSRFYQTAMYREGLMTQQQLADFQAVRSADKPDVPTLLFVSNDAATFGAMLGENGLQKWQDIHASYIEGLSDGKLVQLDCGHYVHVEKPDTVSREIRDFAGGLN